MVTDTSKSLRFQKTQMFSQMIDQKEHKNNRYKFEPATWCYKHHSTALMTKLSTANLLSIHVLILRIFVFGGATRIVGAGSCQSQIGLFKGLLAANPLPGASGLGKLTKAHQ